MAKIKEEQLVITFSRLVKDDEETTSVLNDQLIQILNSLLEEVVAEAVPEKVIVEIGY